MAKRNNKPSAATLALQQARLKHDKWLLKQGAHPSQLKQSRPERKAVERLEAKQTVGHFNGVSEEYQSELSHTIVKAGARRGLWEELRVSEEKPETLREIKEKATRCLPAYNKGSVQYLGDGKQSLLDAGKKNPTEV